jgi:ribosomal 50S subunit-recycling heat shock protein
MRLDKFLKVSRLIKRRTVANEVSDKGRVLVNGNKSKPSKQLKEGDIIMVESKNNPVIVRVLKIPQGNISVQEAQSLYEVVSSE